MCERGVESKIQWFYDVPGQFKLQEMRKKDVKKEPYTFEYVSVLF